MSKNIFRAFGVVTLVLSISACTATGPTLGSAKIGYGDTEAVETITNEFSSTRSEERRVGKEWRQQRSGKEIKEKRT